MNKCEQLALEQAIKELQSISTIVGEVLYVSGYQELQSQFAQKGVQLNEIFKELTIVTHNSFDGREFNELSPKPIVG